MLPGLENREPDGQILLTPLRTDRRGMPNRITIGTAQVQRTQVFRQSTMVYLSTLTQILTGLSRGRHQRFNEMLLEEDARWNHFILLT